MKTESQSQNEDLMFLKEIPGGEKNRNNKNPIPFNKFIQKEPITSNNNDNFNIIIDLNEKIKVFEVIQKSLYETIQTKSNEVETLKQNETVLLAKNNDLNEKLFTALVTIEDLKTKLVKYGSNERSDTINAVAGNKSCFISI